MRASLCALLLHDLLKSLLNDCLFFLPLLLVVGAALLALLNLFRHFCVGLAQGGLDLSVSP
jgi:hypothetical protein